MLEPLGEKIELTNNHLAVLPAVKTEVDEEERKARQAEREAGEEAMAAYEEGREPDESFQSAVCEPDDPMGSPPSVDYGGTGTSTGPSPGDVSSAVSPERKEEAKEAEQAKQGRGSLWRWRRGTRWITCPCGWRCRRRGSPGGWQCRPRGGLGSRS